MVLALPIVLVAQGLDIAKIDAALGRSGQQTGNVYRIGFPCTDLRVTVDGISIRPGLALGSWAAFSGNNNDAVVTGDLVLLQNEVDPAMGKLRDAGFEITAVHNHLLNETPRLVYMHYMGRGPTVRLADSLRAALAATRTPLAKPAASAPPPAWVKTVEDALSRKGRFTGGVLSFGVRRIGSITENGMTLAPAQGVAETVNFQAAGPGCVATTGDSVLTAEEVNPVISALEGHPIQGTGLHNHMLAEEPRIFSCTFGPRETPRPLLDAPRRRWKRFIPSESPETPDAHRL